MNIKSINHVGVRSLDRAASERFYVGVLGLEPHPTKTTGCAARTAASAFT